MTQTLTDVLPAVPLTGDLMSAELLTVPTMLIRGGTSRGVYLRESDMPADRSLWGPFLIDLMGARDPRQIDGLGGAMPTTSKVCIVGPSRHPDADVDYTFAQIGIGEQRVFWDFNCGNLTPSVGTFAILAGLVPAEPGLTTVRIYQTNTRMLLRVEVPTGPDGSPLVEGDYVIAGVSGSGPAVMTDFSRAVGASLGGALLPTGNAVDVLAVPGIGDVRVSIVDLANMCVFFEAADAGLTGLEMPDQGPEVVGAYVAVRQAAQDLLGVDHDLTVPWPVSITDAATFTALNGSTVAAGRYDFSVRFAGIQSMGDTMHEAYPGTASCCTAVAALIPGTIVNQRYASRAHEDDFVRFAHPSGAMSVEARAHQEDGATVVDRAVLGRTVRPIMTGTAFVRRAEMDRLTRELDPASLTRAGVPGKP